MSNFNGTEDQSEDPSVPEPGFQILRNSNALTISLDDADVFQTLGETTEALQSFLENVNSSSSEKPVTLSQTENNLNVNTSEDAVTEIPNKSKFTDQSIIDQSATCLVDWESLSSFVASNETRNGLEEESFGDKTGINVHKVDEESTTNSYYNIPGKGINVLKIHQAIDPNIIIHQQSDKCLTDSENLRSLLFSNVPINEHQIKNSNGEVDVFNNRDSKIINNSYIYNTSFDELTNVSCAESTTSEHDILHTCLKDIHDQSKSCKEVKSDDINNFNSPNKSLDAVALDKLLSQTIKAEQDTSKLSDKYSTKFDAFGDRDNRSNNIKNYPDLSLSSQSSTILSNTENYTNTSELLNKTAVHNDSIETCTKTHIIQWPVEPTSDSNVRNNNAYQNINSTSHHGYIEPTLSTLEREILIRGERSDSKKHNLLQLPPKVIPQSHSNCEREIVGDDVAKTTAHILCECDIPGVAGAAVPIVTSFNVPNLAQKSNDNNKSMSEGKIPLLKPEFEKQAVSNKSKPISLIPKPIQSSSSRSVKLNLLGRTEKNNCLVSSSSQETNEEAKPSRNICFKSDSSQDRLMTSRPHGNKDSPSNSKSNENTGQELNENQKQRHFRFEDLELKKENHVENLTNEFSELVSRLAQEASDLSDIKNPITQAAAVDNLYKHIVTLKKIAHDLKSIQGRGGSQTNILKRSENVVDNETTDSNNKFRNKDNNRIYIKFTPGKSTVKKRKSGGSEVPTDFDHIAASDADIEDKSIHKDKVPEEVDSMDGVFIPSLDDPPKMEEEDDEDGLDITITFPELQKTLNKDDDSHLSVRFSNISAEALGRLKRCPKEFTLRMDFVQGRMFFKSGKSPANNFSIGPDLKITECVIDNRQSDIINIKPSTECLYTSQIIPVEGTITNDSINILKSTDSELFKVVSLPFVKKKSSVATKSCITFRNNVRRVSNESLLPDRIYYRSMPQIPSLTNILEEPALETAVTGIRTAINNAEKRPRNRSLQKKRTNTSLENVSYDTT